MRYFNILIFASILLYSDAFQSHCTTCHQMERQLQMFIYRYTLKHSSEKKIKSALFDYLKNPQAQNSVMPMGFINRWGVKKPSTLNDKTLKEAIDGYYQRYNLKKVWQ